MEDENDNKLERYQKKGICPKCGHTTLKYKPVKITANCLIYDFNCSYCGAKGSVVYSIRYSYSIIKGDEN